MNYRNKVQLIGAVSNKQVFESPKGILYCRFTITTNEAITNLDGETINKGINHPCIAIKKQAAFLRDIVVNGNTIALEGRLIHMENNTGLSKKTETVVEVFELLKLH